MIILDITYCLFHLTALLANTHNITNRISSV